MNSAYCFTPTTVSELASAYGGNARFGGGHTSRTQNTHGIAAGARLSRCTAQVIRDTASVAGRPCLKNSRNPQRRDCPTAPKELWRNCLGYDNDIHRPADEAQAGRRVYRVPRQKSHKCGHTVCAMHLTIIVKMRRPNAPGSDGLRELFLEVHDPSAHAGDSWSWTASASCVSERSWKFRKITQLQKVPG